MRDGFLSYQYTMNEQILLNLSKQHQQLETSTEKALITLFNGWCGEMPEKLIPLPPTASHRKYYRLQSQSFSAIGVYNNHVKENRAFVLMTRFFLSQRINVPQLYAHDLDQNIYLQEDLGDQMLFSLFLNQVSKHYPISLIRQWQKKALKELARMQIMGGRKMDFSICYPYQVFDKDAIIFDLNYFRIQFLDQLNIPYNKEKLNKSFHELAGFILQADNNYFMYRDFQSRNIMVYNDNLYFIDYQGGRKGPLQYDLASFLFQARAALAKEERDKLLEHYMHIVSMLTPVDKNEFLLYYYPIALVRVLQTLGAYGLRGLKEKKQHFIESIPWALKNVFYLEEKIKIAETCPELSRVIGKLKTLKQFKNGRAEING